MTKLNRSVAVTLAAAMLFGLAGCGERPQSAAESGASQPVSSASEEAAELAASAGFASVGEAAKPTASAEEVTSGAESAASAPVESVELVPVDPILIAYLYQPQSGLYLKREAGEAPDTLFAVLRNVAASLGLSDPPVLSITQQKGMVTVNFAPGMLALYSEDERAVLFNSFAMTLQKNHRGYEWIQYQLDGDWNALGAEKWQTAPLKLIEGDPEAFKKLRDKVLYRPNETDYNYRDEMNALNLDETAKKIANLLSSAYIEGRVFASPAELPTDSVVRSSLKITQGYTTWAGADIYNECLVADELEPIFASVSLKLNMQEDLIWLEEHVEQSAKRLFGSGYVVEHQTAGKYTYFPEEGVYTPPHMGGGYGVLTAVLDYADSGENMTATVSYACEVMGGIFEPKDFEKQISPDQLENYLRNIAKRYTVTLGKADDGTLYIISQQPA